MKLIAVSSKMTTVRMGCLSAFRWRGLVLCSADVIVRGYDENGNVAELGSEGNADVAALLQHENEHNHGKLFPDSLADGEVLHYHPDKPDFAPFPGPTGPADPSAPVPPVPWPIPPFPAR